MTSQFKNFARDYCNRIDTGIDFLRMGRRTSRVSKTQWNILLDFLERKPNLVRFRGYNNSARGRAESLHLWQELSKLLNAEGTGTTKTPKDWSIYVSNYKSKLKKIVSDINTDADATDGGPLRGSTLTDSENRFLAIMGPGFGQTAHRVNVNPVPNTDLHQPSTLATPDKLHVDAVKVQSSTASLDEARRILSQVEMQRAAADAASAHALNLIGRNLGRLADAAERYLSSIGAP